MPHQHHTETTRQAIWEPCTVMRSLPPNFYGHLASPKINEHRLTDMLLDMQMHAQACPGGYTAKDYAHGLQVQANGLSQEVSEASR